ncbi:hypothetical protein [Dyadobacter sp. CY312]|uniref:hypothetical protein n=1 Tax=Dyadobacter sp. CY312 TaxID=2907303 RepID=UPI001F335BD4|nr:hypothetical protein [Dyadobacter sp. CY312]MCE7039336.1 hypothetical protein [Dyadobacter sp. CY312]
MEIAPLKTGENVFGWTIDTQKSYQISEGMLMQASILLIQQMPIPWLVKGYIGGESEEIMAAG